MENNEELNEEEIRIVAYGLWELAGKPDGKADQFWEDAKRELAFANPEELKTSVNN